MFFGLMNHDRDRHPYSRDWGTNISCAVTTCPCNDQAGHCSTPSVVKIGPDGRCRVGNQMASKKLKKPKE